MNGAAYSYWHTFGKQSGAVLLLLLALQSTHLSEGARWLPQGIPGSQLQGKVNALHGFASNRQNEAKVSPYIVPGSQQRLPCRDTQHVQAADRSHTKQLLATASAIITTTDTSSSSSSSSSSLLQGATRAGRRLMQLLLLNNFSPIRIQGLTTFANSPAAASSTSVGQDAKAQIGPEGSLQLGGGLSVAKGVAFSKRAINPRTDTRLNNRPLAFTAAYVTTPLSLSWTFFPTIGYSFSESQGDVFSATNGFYIIDEFGYNAISNNLGNSLSVSQAGAVNLGGADTLRLTGDGLSGYEMIGTANAQVDFADARAAQTAQAIAYPFNILLLVNPLTCTQLFITASAIANYDLGAQPQPFLRRNPPQIIPFCLEFFNTATLDTFVVLLNDVPDIFDFNFLFSDQLDTSDDLLKKAGFDPFGSSVQVPLSGRFSLSGPDADGALVTPLDLLKAGNVSVPMALSNASVAANGTAALPAANMSDPAVRDELYAVLADLTSSFDSRVDATLEALMQSRLGAGAASTSAGSSPPPGPAGAEGAVLAADVGGPGPAAGAAGDAQQLPLVSGLAGPAAGAAAGAAGLGSQEQLAKGAGAAVGVPGFGGPASVQQLGQQVSGPGTLAGAALPIRQGTGSSLVEMVPATGADEASFPAAMESSGDSAADDSLLRQAEQEPQGPLSSLLDGLAKSPIARFLQKEAEKLPVNRLATGTSAVLRNLTASGTVQVANQTAEVRRQAFDLAGQVAYNASDLGIRSFVKILDAADPVIKMAVNATQSVYEHLANASSGLVDAAVGLLVNEVAAKGADLQAVVENAVAKEEVGPGRWMGS